MAFSSTDTEIIYTTDGVDMTFEIPFSYAHEDFIRVETYDETDPDNVVYNELEKDVDFQFVDDDTIETIELVLVGMDLVPTPTALAAGLTLRIFRDTADIHNTTYSTYQFPYATVNTDFDKVYQRLQELKREIDRSVSLGVLALANGDTLTGEQILDAIADLEQLIDDLSAGANGTVPLGGVAGDVLTKNSSTDLDSSWAAPVDNSVTNALIFG